MKSSNVYRTILRLLLLPLVFSASIPTTSDITLPLPLNTTSSSSSNLTLPLTPFCINPSPRCGSPTYLDCTALLTYIGYHSPAASRKLREFTLRPTPPSSSNWQVPSTFYYKTCRLTLSLRYFKGPLEWSSFAEIAQNAQIAVETCFGSAAVVAKGYSGGFNLAGLADGLGVLVHGQITGPIVQRGDEGVELSRRGGGDGESCERVEEGRVVDVGALGGAGFDGGNGELITGGEATDGLVSTDKVRR